VEELERRLEELENVQNRAVTGAVIVENCGGGDHDQNLASSTFSRKERRLLWMGAALALLLVVGVILGVAIPLANKKPKDEYGKGPYGNQGMGPPMHFPPGKPFNDRQSPSASPSFSASPISSPTTLNLTPAPTVAPTLAPEPGVTPPATVAATVAPVTSAPTLAPVPGMTTPPNTAPTVNPTPAPVTSPPTPPPVADATPSPSKAPTKDPTQSPTKCTRLDCLAEILLQNEVLDAEALQEDSSPQFQALRWLANEDTAVLDLDSTPTVILVQRYVLAVLYFATSGEAWRDEGNFLSASSVCMWNNGERGVFCNGDDLVVVALDLSKSKHEENIFHFIMLH
jgi:hypothetical protein